LLVNFRLYSFLLFLFNWFFNFAFHLVFDIDGGLGHILAWCCPSFVSGLIAFFGSILSLILSLILNWIFLQVLFHFTCCMKFFLVKFIFCLIDCYLNFLPSLVLGVNQIFDPSLYCLVWSWLSRCFILRFSLCKLLLLGLWFILHISLHRCLNWLLCEYWNLHLRWLRSLVFVCLLCELGMCNLLVLIVLNNQRKLRLLLFCH